MLGGLVPLAGLPVRLHQKALAQVGQAEGARQRAVGPHHLFLAAGLLFAAQQEGKGGHRLAHRRVKLRLKQLLGLLLLPALAVQKRPHGGGVPRVLGQFVQQGFGLVRVVLCQRQTGQLDGGRLPVGRRARGAHPLQQFPLEGAPAGLLLRLRVGEEHLKAVAHHGRVELQGGAAGPAAHQPPQFFLAGIGPLLGQSFHQGVDLPRHFLVGQGGLKLQKGVHGGVQCPRQGAQQRHVRAGSAGLPLAHRRAAHSHQRRQLLLGQPPAFAQSGDGGAHLQGVGLFHKASSSLCSVCARFFCLYCTPRQAVRQERRIQVPGRFF